jgi:hypothetical protein
VPQKREGMATKPPRLSKRRSVACPARARNCARATYEVQTDLQVAALSATVEPFVSRLMQARKA